MHFSNAGTETVMCSLVVDGVEVLGEGTTTHTCLLLALFFSELFALVLCSLACRLVDGRQTRCVE